MFSMSVLTCNENSENRASASNGGNSQASGGCALKPRDGLNRRGIFLRNKPVGHSALVDVRDSKAEDSFDCHPARS